MPDRWLIRERKFPFRVSQLTLHTAVLAVAQLDRHFTELDGPESITPPFDDHPEVDVFSVRPCPVKGRQPLLSWRADSLLYVPVQYARSYTDLRTTWEEYLKRFSAKSRYNKNRAVKQYQKFAGSEALWREYRDPAQMAEFYRLARQIAKTTYQEKLAGAGMPADPAYLDEMVRQARDGGASGHLLMHGERPVAYVYLVYRNDIVYFEFAGFDPEYMSHSPGGLLLFKVLESLFRAGKYRLFDYGEGEGTHKDAYATHQVECADLYFFRRTPRLIATAAGQAALLEVTRRLRAAAVQLGVADRLKQMMGIKRVSPP